MIPNECKCIDFCPNGEIARGKGNYCQCCEASPDINCNYAFESNTSNICVCTCKKICDDGNNAIPENKCKCCPFPCKNNKKTSKGSNECCDSCSDKCEDGNIPVGPNCLCCNSIECPFNQKPYVFDNEKCGCKWDSIFKETIPKKSDCFYCRYTLLLFLLNTLIIQL